MEQTKKDKFWEDESGGKVPYSRTTKAERNREAKAAKLLKSALEAQQKLQALKDTFSEICDDVYAEAIEAVGAKPGKGNFTWFNFDRSVKIEVAISEAIKFDDISIEAAKQKFDVFLEKNLSATNEVVRELIQDAFSTNSNGLDTKKVMSLVRYKTRVADKDFLEAIALIEAALRRPSSRTRRAAPSRSTHSTRCPSCA